jgi:phosphopantetheine--protein transferase-like protein
MVIGLKKITENEYTDDLNQAEVKRISTYGSLKRRLEAYSSLRLLKLMLREKGITDFEIERCKSGKPYLINIDLFFNLSHSFEYSSCVIASVEVGIDIEKISSKANKITNRFLHPDELKNHALKHFSDEELTTIWTVKEAYSKLISRGLTKRFNSLKVIKHDGYYEIIDGTDKCFAKSFKYDNSIVTVSAYKLTDITNEIKIY